MTSSELLEFGVVVAVLAVAGVVKGVIGLGLPTIAMGLLGALMTPNQAAAILVVPATLTNVWQMWDGPALKILLRRLWPMLVCALLGTLPAADILTKASVSLTTALLGVILMIYALIGLVGVHFKVSRRAEPLLGPLVGLNRAYQRRDGYFCRPRRPLRASAQPRKGRVSAGVGDFCICLVGGSRAGLGLNNGLNGAVAISAMVALAGAFAGMAIGKALRSQLSIMTFRRWVFVGLLALGASMLVRFVL